MSVSSSVNINYNNIAPENYIWNRNDITTVASTGSIGSSSSGSTLTQDFKNDILNFVANSDTNFLPRTGGNLVGALTLDQGVFFSDQSYQSTAFTDQKNSDLASVVDNTQFITSTSSETVVSGTLQCDSLSIPNQSLNMNKINNLQTVIDTVTTEITAIKDINTSQSANITANTNSINSINTLNTTQTNNITTNTNSINNITGTLLPLKQNVISSSNKVSSDFIATGASILTNKLDSIDATLSNLSTNKQDLLNNTTNKLPLNHVDITNTSLVYVDIDSSLSTDLSNLFNTNLTQDSRLNTIEGTLPDINSAITGLQEDMNTNSNSITNLTAVVEDHTTDLSEFGTILTNHDNSIQTLETTVASHETSIQSHESTLNTYGNDIATQSVSISNLQNADITLQSSIDLKQDAITVSNKLGMNVVGNGDVTNNELSVLSGILTDRTIQYQINQMSNAISNLDGLQDLDITSINNINSSITTISGRLDSLESADATQSTFNSNTTDALNTINSAISSIQGIDSLQASSISSLTASVTSLDINKQNIIDDNAPLLASYIQTGLDSRLNEDLIAINQNISNLVSGKQDAIVTLSSSLIDYSSSALRFVDISSNLQEQLTNLENNDTSLGSNISTIQSDLLSTQLDVSALQTSVTTLQTSVNDIPAIQDELVTLQNNIDTKQNIIDVNHTIPYTYVSFSGSDLVHVDVTSSLNASLTNLANDIDGVETIISGINTEISNLQSADIIHDNAIISINSDITDLRNSKQPLIDSSHKLSSLLVTTGSETLSSKLASIDDSIAGKMDLIDSSHKLSSSLVDYSSSALRYVDITSNLQSQLTNITGAISTLQSLQNGDIQTFQDIQSNFDTLDTTVSGKVNKSGDTMTGNLVFGADAKIKYDSGTAGYVLTSDNQGNLTLQQPSATGSGGYDSISYDAPTTTTTILDTTKLTSLKFSGDSSIQTTAFTSTKDSNLSGALTAISALQTDNTTNISNISTLQNNVSSLTSTVGGKQNTIDSSNKLASSNIDYSASPLQYVDSGITQNLSTSLSGLSSSISALQSSDTTQTNNISTLSSSVASLQSGKQDLISSTNKISSLNVSYGVSSNVSSTLDSINTSLSGKANLTGATFTGSVTATNFIGTISNATNATSATNATNATNIGVTLDTTTNSNHFVPFVGATTGNNPSKVSTGLTYNPNTQTLTALNFNGNATTSSGTSQIAVADFNTNTTNYITFVTNANNQAQTLRMDNSVTPLTYNPSTSTLSLGALKYASGSAGQVPISDGTGLLTLGTPSSSITNVSGTWSIATPNALSLNLNGWNTLATLTLTAGTWYINANFVPTPNIITVSNAYTGLALSTGGTGSIFYMVDSCQNGGNSVTARANWPTINYIYTTASTVTLTLYVYCYILVSSGTLTYNQSNNKSYFAIKLA